MSTVASEITEVENLLAVATFDGVKAVLNAHLAKLKKSEIDLAAKKEREAGAKSNEAGDTVEKKPISVAAISKTAYIPIEDFAWDQGEYGSQTISIFIDLDGVGAAKDRVETNFAANSFDLKVTDLNGKNYRLFKDNLEKNIVPDKCKAIVKANKIVLKLQKVKGEYSYEQWSSLIGKKKKTDEPAAKKDPMGGIMDMMKDLYEDGDENMKKIIGEAMLKSQRGEKPEPPSVGDF
mmetsp:Transcript_43181/g.75053  ORF Transcript_43181/g.75053 Transcript_43181/m.75053 type:complete len:235 (-) Transcript_43181:62-766(-)